MVAKHHKVMEVDELKMELLNEGVNKIQVKSMGGRDILIICDL